jgi:SnoaL-like domain
VHQNGQSVRVSVEHFQVRAWAENYLDVVKRRDPDQIAELFALNATVEDPVGPSLYEGREAIRELFARPPFTGAARRIGQNVARKGAS